MKNHYPMFAIEKMCKVLKVSRSGYYQWLRSKPSAREVENQMIKERIKEIYRASKKRYGSPKITKELNHQDIRVSRPRVARMMRSMNLRSIINKRYKVPTTDSKHKYSIADNYLNRNFQVQRKSQVWVSDITYFRADQRWLYLTIIMDLYDRKVIGWALSESLTAKDTVSAAWTMATLNRPLYDKLLFHSDRGVQYACNEFTALLAKGKRVTQSMSRKGDCWDNAVAESFFKIIKSEMIYHNRFRSKAHARLEVFEFIEIWYNRKRRHSSLGYLTPLEFEQKEILRKVA